MRNRFHWNTLKKSVKCILDFFSYYDSPLLVINVDNVDFVSNPEDYNELVSHIKRDVVGKEYINLSQTIF